MPRRLQLVVNPAAGGGRAEREAAGVEVVLRAAGHDVVTRLTRSLEHADQLCAAALQEDRVVVAMGGDGLIGRLAAGVSAGGGLMALVPGGRGNDFARAVGVPLDPLQACRVLDTGTETQVDLGCVNAPEGESVFVGIASIGFDSEVQERVLRTRLPLGQGVYAYGALAAVAAWKPATFTGTVDGERLALTGWAVAVSNSGRYGGGMRLAPDASVTDGLLDLVTTARISKARFLRTFPKVFKGTHVGDPAFQVRHASVVELSADRAFRVFADGDPVGTLPATISVRPGALRLLLPPRPRKA